MHQEFDPADQPFAPRSRLGLYAFTAIIGALLIADLWPPLAGWLQSLGVGVPTWTTRELFTFRFALIAAVLGGAKVVTTSLEKLTEGRVSAELAVAVACFAAILIGESIVAAEVVFINLVGECLEAVTFDRTSALRRLAELFPLRCWVLRDGQEVRVLTSELQVGDRVVVKPGGKVPVDGVVIDGRSAVDVSALTGESVPVEKQPGETILAGSIVQNGSLTIEARKVAKQTVAGQVIELTASALRDKGRGERLADRMAKYFLPVVLVLAAVTFLFNLYLASGPIGPDALRPKFSVAARVALYPTLAVLVVACPCPLVLATPAAVIAALGRLAGTGVLIKGGSVLERLATVKSFAFDKTGTLTLGRLEIGDVLPIGAATANELLQSAATAEQRSEHPIAKTILASAMDCGLTLEALESFQAHPGAGVTAKTASGLTLLVGTRRLLEEQGITIPDAALAHLRRLDETGQTSLLVVRDGEVLGAIGARDTIRPEAHGVLTDLHALGITPITLLTGDRESVAKSLAAQLPLTAVHAELLPAQKALAVSVPVAVSSEGSSNRSSLPTDTDTGTATAFVGDGINDAPALARASVGIAIGTGTDIAAEAGDIVMMGEPLRPLPMLVRLSRETVRIIRQNILWFGFGVNLVGVLVSGWLWPVFASSPEWFEKAPLFGVLYHQLGSLAVLLNSLRLLGFERTADSTTAKRVRAGYRTIDQWLAKLNPDDLLHEALHRWKPIAAGTGVVLLLAWLLSGITQIGASEAGVVQRFGAVRGHLTPGLHVRWPWPIEQVTKLRPGEVRTVEVGFRILSAEKQELLRQGQLEQEKLRRPGLTPAESMSWASAHSEGVSTLSDESMLITADGYIVELLATVRYTVSDPQAYLFGTPDPDAVIRSAAESVFREHAASREFFELLSTERGDIERRTTARLTRRIEQFAPSLGVRLESVSVHDLHPPQEVVKSFHDVANAIQRRDKTINDADTDATGTVRRSRQTALRVGSEGDSIAAEQVASVTASRDVFLRWAETRAKLLADEEAALAAELDRRTKTGEDATTVTNDLNTRRQTLLVLRRELTEFRLATDAAAATLVGRDKVLIDTDKLPGKRHLILGDPGSSLVPSIIVPRETNPDVRGP